MFLLIAGACAGNAAAAVIFVTSVDQKIGGEESGCSLQEAIYSANFDDNIAIARFDEDNAPVFIRTECVKGFGDDTIVLPSGTVLEMDHIQDDAFNPFGPTATPIITTHITIEAHGATLQRTGTTSFRAFAVGSTGHLTLRDATIKGFVARGGNGGPSGGGGLGAGGAIFVHAGGVTVEACTFQGNGAIGGDGGKDFAGNGGGGGGGMGGNGAPDGGVICQGGFGGGGSRGNGGFACANGSITDRMAGGGGGTLRNGFSFDPHGGFDCGGNGGVGNENGQDAPCPGGGGGGGGMNTLTGSGNGGRGNYGGGGGGGSDGGGSGGAGGFGGGGGSGWAGTVDSADGGHGGFGGGGGAGPDGLVTGGTPGPGGLFAGDGNHLYGGGGAALGGAVFNDSGSVDIQNSTFTENFVTRGMGGNAGESGAAANGTDAGGAIFSVDGHLSVLYSTIVDNEATGFGDGVVAIQTSESNPASFTLANTLIAYTGPDIPIKGPQQCSWAGFNMETSFAANIVRDNDTPVGAHPFPANWNGCGAVVSDASPGVSPLTLQQGFTPTMAITMNSPAFNAADPSVTVGVDQRGQERPAMGGYDIGAFELCFTGPPQLFIPCQIPAGARETFALTLRVSPEGAGTTNPAAGDLSEPANTVIGLRAIPNAGYRFKQWLGPVTSPSFSVTTLVMNADKMVTAVFEVSPDFTFSAIAPLTLPVGGSGSRTVTVNANATFSQAVALSASQLPGGASASLTPTPVTPPFSGSAGSQLSLQLGPSVQPGSYILNVVGTAGLLTHAAPVSLTVQASPASVGQVIGTLGTLGCIDNSGIVNAFTAKLAQAQAAIDAGDQQTAINLLSALLQQLQAQAGKHLHASCVDGQGNTFDPVQTLINDVNALLAGLGASLKANPVMGMVVSANNVEVVGATVSLLSASKTVILSATTDATGFYVFPKITALRFGTTYTVKVTVPKGFKSSTPASPSFTWSG
ncbi:MAG TPA: choice-of-anchor Q domain-containing protein, partial [Candidatus Polarisedimenticolia bacterium]|nr:choice-of-anchor Q domain-containing protein [Candidatus Polarisedimenticolia bacterium]